MQKILLAICLFIICNLFSQEFKKDSRERQGRFYVKGKIDGMPDGEILSLFRYRDGSIDAASSDTIHNGKFLLSDTVSGPMLYWILGGSDKFPAAPLEIWAAPGISAEISGKGYLFKTWNVKSSVREQQEENQYLKPSVADWNRWQELQIQRNRIRQKMRTAAEKEKESLESRQDSLSDQITAVMNNIDLAQIQLLRKLPVTEVWLHKMHNLAFGIKLDPQSSHKESVLQLYKRMTNQQRTSLMGEKITANLFPPIAVKTGDTMADLALLDIQMATHTLAEYKGKGKLLLLDFWFVNCGPCRMAIPETKALSDSLINELTIIGINVDETAYWKEKSKEEPISWVNFNDSKGRSGIAYSYGVEGYPHYVMISPEGIVLGAWTGYEQGDLTKQIKRYIKNQ